MPLPDRSTDLSPGAPGPARPRSPGAPLALLALACLLSACSDGGDDGGGPVDGGNGFSGVLSPLPDPPLTPGPSADDEPVAEIAAFHTITDFALVREPAPRIRSERVAELEEADFAAGLPPPRIETPAGLDPATNGAPFFEGLDNTRVVAGQLLELRFVPRDPDGGLPGMFSQRLPPGATFDDNLDGTKSLRWQTFQADVGVTSFTVVAIDPAVPDYRTSQTVLIAVDAPADASSVPNAPPGIEPIEDYTVRVGDPVAIELVGTDRNGTRPSIELVDPPPGTTLTLDPRDDDRAMMRLVPTAAGTLAIRVLTRDADDASLTGLDTISLQVRERADFERDGDRLHTLAAARDVQFGSALSPLFYRQADGGVYGSVAESEFAVLTPESSMKWNAINPLPGRFRFADVDNLVRFATQNGMALRGHPLVWHRELPAWVEATAVADRQVHLREFITRVMTRYADAVELWDVVNEPIADAGGLRESLWSEAMGESYIDIAFHQARALDPSATLVLNEYDIGFAGPKFDSLLALLDRLIEREVPIDAIGFQLHVFAGFDRFDELAANMAAIAERGLDVHVTELDVALSGGADESAQAIVYRRLADTCLAQSRCTVLQTWGFTDQYSFRRNFDPLYLDRDYQPKPAYRALQEVFGERR